jgi:hypothetical protein
MKSALLKITWSRRLPAVARRIRRCSSVVSVVDERCGTRTGSLGGGGSQGDASTLSRKLPPARLRHPRRRLLVRRPPSRYLSCLTRPMMGNFA